MIILKKYLEEIKKKQIESSSPKRYFSYYKEIEDQINSLGVFIDAKIKIYLTEGVWQKSNYKDWYYRLDSQNMNNKTLKHIHIARKKHKNSIPQFSWDILGKRHDAHKFDEPIPNAAKELAAKVLGIKTDLLEASYIDDRVILLG